GRARSPSLPLLTRGRPGKYVSEARPLGRARSPSLPLLTRGRPGKYVSEARPLGRARSPSLPLLARGRPGKYVSEARPLGRARSPSLPLLTRGLLTLTENLMTVEETLRELVAIDSVSSRSNAEIISYLETRCGKNGFVVKRFSHLDE